MGTHHEAVVDEYRPKLERNLQESILDFWHPRSVDTEHGGYITSYDSTGAFAGNDDKMIVTQARMVCSSPVWRGRDTATGST